MQTAQNGRRGGKYVLLSIPFSTSNGTRNAGAVISQIPRLIFQTLKALLVWKHAMKVNNATGNLTHFKKRLLKPKANMFYV